ncbi:MarR family transcriptional regulator [Sphingomonas sp. ID1715]|uniref:MarR family transcriptional regulator n=1 Tax=Sphingomonas sp. ID1715 TaxID=1656898 RepID=UPI001489E6FB|nr:helix-turn-helix domain-containing protein [Sphingomonas sp. ID1715]NNM75755.1 MarR family transcriptional regulator [Sphingomonas sp. ID1715]
MASFPSALFLREPEVRRGLELMFAGQAELARAVEPILAGAKLGRAHQRALYFIGRHADSTVGALLTRLGVTKQSFNRTLNELVERGLVEVRVGRDDRRQRLLRLTDSGRALEAELFEAMRARLASAYAQAGQQAVGGFWAVLEGLA